MTVGSGQAGAALDFSPPLLRGHQGNPPFDFLVASKHLQWWATDSFEEVLYCLEDFFFCWDKPDLLKRTL